MKTHFNRGCNYITTGICTDNFEWGVDIYVDEQAGEIEFGLSFARGVLELNLAGVSVSITTPLYNKKWFDLSFLSGAIR